VNRLLLVRHATTSSTRRACFPATTGARAVDGCEPLDRGGGQQATALRGMLPRADHCWTSHTARAQETARLAGFAPEPFGDLAECDFGRWAGALPTEVGDPGAVQAWYADPDGAPHGGEGFRGVRARAARVLGRARDLGGTVVAFTHGGLIKAALCEALGLPSSALWRLDVAPASVSELHPAGDDWRVVRLNWEPGRLR